MPFPSRRSFLIGAALLASTRPAFAVPRALTVASLFGPDKPETKIWHLIRDRVEQKLPGRFKFRIVENAALGGEKEVAEGIRLGSVQASLCTASVLSAWVPELQLLDLPFLFRDPVHLHGVMEGEVGAHLQNALAAQNFIAPAFINYGARNLLAKRELLSPADLKGLHIRVIQSPLHTELWRGYGAKPVAIAIPETYNALKTGVADAMDLTVSAYAGFKLYEVVPCMIETRHIWASGVVYFAKTFWNSLAPEEQVVFAEAAKEGAVTFNTMMREDETASLHEAKKAGAWVAQPQDRTEWEKGAQKVWETYAPIVGGMDKIEKVRAQG